MVQPWTQATAQPSHYPLAHLWARKICKPLTFLAAFVTQDCWSKSSPSKFFFHDSFLIVQGEAWKSLIFQSPQGDLDGQPATFGNLYSHCLLFNRRDNYYLSPQDKSPIRPLLSAISPTLCKGMWLQIESQKFSGDGWTWASQQGMLWEAEGA